MGAIEQKGGEPNMPTTLKRTLVGLGLAGALFLGAGAAVAQTTGGGSSSGTSGGATTTVQDDGQNRSATDCPERGGNDSNGADESTA
jgi:hypothetical protein